MPRKLTYLSTAIIPSMQANSIQIMKMCSAMSRSGFNVTLFSGTRPRHRKVDIFKYYGIENKFSVIRKFSGCHRGSSFLLSIRFYPMLRRLIRSKQDILFYGRDVLALYFLALAGQKVIYEVHDPFEKGPRSWAERKLIEGGNISKIVFISHELKKAYLEKYGDLMLDKRMIVAPDATEEPSNFSEVVKLNGKADFNVCYIGSFLKGRGIELILDIARRMSDTGFHLFGGTNNEVHQFEKMSSSNVYFYGYIPPFQTYKARNAADVLLMPYQKNVMVAQNASETSNWMSPIKLFEYMSAKKPIISSNHCVLQEVLKHNYNCLLCDPDDVEQWIEAITKLKNDEQFRSRISVTAYRDFIENYTWDKRIERILSED